jgi:transketolase
MYGKTLVELGACDLRVVVLEADIAKSTNTYRFQEAYPDRFFEIGVAELNMVCMAAGLAATGFVPFATTFCVFASMRACEGIRTSIAYPKLNVKVVATNAGAEIAGDGTTHQAIEDLAIMRAIPNLTVLSPSDPVTTRLAVLAMARIDGPFYMRLGRQTATVLYSERTHIEIGRMIQLRDGDDVTLIATGHMVEQALIAACALSAEGIEARVLDCHTIKPIDVEAIVRAARETAAIITVEDHSVIGGLGSAVCEVVAERCPTVVRRVGIGDKFPGSGRDYRELLSHYGLDAAHIVQHARAALASRGILI